MPLRKLKRVPVAFGVLAVLVLTPACGGKRAPALATAAPGEGDDRAGRQTPMRENAFPEGADLRSLEGESASGSDIPGGSYIGEGGPLADIRFEYDSAALTDEARSVLEKHALWLQGQREVRVIVEGHCDERGTVEYNLALGEQRARAVRDYLASLGVAGARLRVASYGKERPLDPGHDEAAMSRNRRAHFNVSR